MPYIKLRDGTEIGVTFEDLVYSIKQLFTGSTPHLKYDLGFITGFYSKESQLLKLQSHRGDILAPYVTMFDYRNRTFDKTWGHVAVSNPYEFPGELVSHRDRMVIRFNKEGKLRKGNRPCPRVLDVKIAENGLPSLTIQKAFYYDQVGTNLTPDEPLSPSLMVRGLQCVSVRDWDLNQADCQQQLPTFIASKIANTIGVAVGLTAPDEYGRFHIIRRRRTEEVAVYEGQWHVPFSFALAWPDTLQTGDLLDLSHLILPDYGHEFAEELRGLEITDFEPARPLAFCRDMVRAGKPQFFFEIRSRIPLNKLKPQIKSDGAEYVKDVGVVSDLAAELSPELLAFSILVDRLS